MIITMGIVPKTYARQVGILGGRRGLPGENVARHFLLEPGRGQREKHVEVAPLHLVVL